MFINPVCINFWPNKENFNIHETELSLYNKLTARLDYELRHYRREID